MYFDANIIYCCCFSRRFFPLSPLSFFVPQKGYRFNRGEGISLARQFHEPGRFSVTVSSWANCQFPHHCARECQFLAR